MVKHPPLAKAIADVGWGEFVRRLEYKATWADGSRAVLAAVYRKHDVKRSRVDVRRLRGTAHHDVNAAKNIRAAGLAVLPLERPDQGPICLTVAPAW